MFPATPSPSAPLASAALPVSTRLVRFAGSLVAGLPGIFWALWAGLLVTRAGTFVVPMLFVYLTRVQGRSATEAGTVVSLYGFGALVGVLVGGQLADRVGRRFTLLASLLPGAGLMVALGFSHQLWHFLVLAPLVGAVGEMYRPASQAVVADVVPPALRLKAFAWQYWAVNLGFSVAATLGGYLATRNAQLLFLGDAATTLALAAIVLRFIPETRPASTAQSKPGAWYAPFVDARFAPFLVLNFLLILVFFQHLSVLPMDMAAKGLSPEHYGLVIASNGVLIVLLQPFVTRAVARLPVPATLATAAALVGVGFGATYWATSVAGYVGTIALWTLGEILFAPVNATLVANLSPDEMRGRYQGAFTLTWSLAAMLSPLLGPRLAEATSLGTVWSLCLALGLGIGATHLLFAGRLIQPATSTSR